MRCIRTVHEGQHVRERFLELLLKYRILLP